MSDREIVFKIKPGGKVTVEVNGACGEECADLTAPFEQAIGTVEDTELKPEYYNELEVAEQYVGE